MANERGTSGEQQPIVARVVATREDWEAAFDCVLQHRKVYRMSVDDAMRQTWRRMPLGFGMYLAAGAGVGSVFIEPMPIGHVLGGSLGIMAAIVHYGRWMLRDAHVAHWRKAYVDQAMQHSDDQAVSEVWASTAGVHTRKRDDFEWLVSWKGVRCIVDTATHIWVITHATVQPIPKRAFDTASEAQTFLATLRSLHAEHGISEESRVVAFLANSDEMCRHCSYPFRGIQGKVCPECGREIDLDEMQYRAARRKKKR